MRIAGLWAEIWTWDLLNTKEYIKNRICHYATLCEMVICDSDGVTGEDIKPIKAVQTFWINC
jgi:hypothetical protein